MQIFALILIAAILVAVLLKFAVQRLVVRETVYEYERALLYRDGKFQKILEPGSYWLLPFNMTIAKLDIRPTYLIAPNQELLTADSMSVKISLALNYRVVDVYAALHMVDSYYSALYTVAQLALREVVSPLKIDELMTARQSLSEDLQKAIAPRTAEFGIEVLSADIRDIMVPGELKKVMTQVVKAQKEAQAGLEKARGETAALRSLANAARMIEASPSLMQLRLLQSIGETAGNTIVYGMPSNGTVVHTAAKPKATPEKSDQD